MPRTPQKSAVNREFLQILGSFCVSQWHTVTVLNDSTCGRYRRKTPDVSCHSSSRMPGNHMHGNGLPATFVPGRRNVHEGSWAANESLKKLLASLFHCLLNVKSTSQILRAYLTGKEKPV